MAVPTEMLRARALALAFLTGQISRQELLARATEFGVGLPILGATLASPVYLQSGGRGGRRKASTRNALPPSALRRP